MSHAMQGPHPYPVRPKTDIFHGDPFKIQSYKFRYAERPVYPVQHYQRPEPQPQPTPSRAPQFETYYRNAKFSRDPECASATPSARMMEQDSASFAENRRHNYLRDSQLQHNVSTDSPLLKSCCNRGDYQTMDRGQSTTSLYRNCSTNAAAMSASRSTFEKREREWHQSVADSSSSSIQLVPKRSDCSGCEININKGAQDSESEADNNLRIKIETDTCLLNNTDRAKQPPGHQRSSSASRSTVTFGIDKRLSKFSVAKNKPRISAEQAAKQRVAERELELKMERERARKRERERENLRQQERQRDYERLLELEVEREKERLREVERESQRRKEYDEHQELLRRTEQKRREVPMPMPPLPVPPVIMTSHLYRRTSDDRLPGMVHFCDRPPAAASKRSQRLQSCNKNLPSLRGQKKPTAPTVPPLASTFTAASPIPMYTPAPAEPKHTPAPAVPMFSTAPPVRSARSLERTSSGTSNGNVHVSVSTNGSHRPSTTELYEQKQLNSDSPILTRLNNIPIRITTSRPRDRDLEFSFNQVRLRNHSPIPVVIPRLSSSRLLQGDDSSVQSLNVNITVYADTISRRMRM
ncbi:TRAF3-interacting protein 1 [Drosophila guanche]|uniref:Blast:Synaptic vesicular amine transporter n=1 Tax=Drosophila guanche TaxID=7266 RepID=A0A3B0J3E1_DROGU|nr:TRAF3-interacting protein 1 [Drosophila guanche]SPP73763.1 blast:Synaptic vesicular amine transporter [Drosophila guanche]